MAPISLTTKTIFDTIITKYSFQPFGCKKRNMTNKNVTILKILETGIAKTKMTIAKGMSCLIIRKIKIPMCFRYNYNS